MAAWKRVIVVVALVGNLAGCTVIVPTALGLGARNHNDWVDQRKAAGVANPGSHKAVAPRVGIGVLLGFLLDVAVVGLLTDGIFSDGFGDPNSFGRQAPSP